VKSTETENCIAYSSPAHGGWGIVRVGMLVPETHQLFVCPSACGRHGAISAKLHGYKDRVSYLYLDESDIVSGGYEALIVESTGELLAVIEKPKALLIMVSCLDDLLGTDHQAFLKILRERYPDIQFGVGHMNPLSAEGKLPPAVNIQRSIYGFLKPSKERLPLVNLVGCHTPPAPGCELYPFLEGLGFGTRHISQCRTFSEYQRLSSGSLNLVIGPSAKTAAEEMKKRLGIDWIFTPISYDPDEIEDNYCRIAQKLGKSPDFAFDAWRERLARRLKETRNALGERRIVIDDAATIRPFSLAKLLIQNGFRVVEICAEACPGMEEASFKWLEQNSDAVVREHTKHTAPVIRESSPDILAIGFECAYLHGACHVVDQLEDESQYGYGGIMLLLDKMKQASSSPVELQKLIQDYGLVV
jgi:nitrogenase molybdenum-iron protein alpha/beta subunit